MHMYLVILGITNKKSDKLDNYIIRYQNRVGLRNLGELYHTKSCCQKSLKIACFKWRYRLFGTDYRVLNCYMNPLAKFEFKRIILPYLYWWKAPSVTYGQTPIGTDTSYRKALLLKPSWSTGIWRIDRYLWFWTYWKIMYSIVLQTVFYEY